MNVVLQEMLQTGGFTTETGERVRLDVSSLPHGEGAFVHRLVARLQPKTLLEVGLAYGASTLYIADALASLDGARYIIIDPQQQADLYRGLGLQNLKRAGYEAIVEFYAESSHLALPKLEAAGTKIDFAFIDGRHLFDWVLLDFFYIDRMLNVGGVVVLDDANASGIRKVCRFIAANRSYTVYARSTPALKYLLSPSPNALRIPPPLAMATDFARGLMPGSRCIAFQKQADDARMGFDYRAF